MKFKILLLTALALSSAALFAEEGMWLFMHPPTAQLKAKYGFEPTQQWYDHLRLGSVRFNSGGSGSFISADGLAFTNHHVGRSCMQQMADKDHDYIKNGFWAKTQAEEAKCPDLELNVLVGADEVTQKVLGAAPAGAAPAEAAKAQREAIKSIEGECKKSTGLRCDVVSLYQGGVYYLYKYKAYRDVRLVFAPEGQMAFFGGDRDNFEFPRYDLDICFFRVYENGKPAATPDYLHWSKEGVKAGDLVFVSGNPGGTERMLPFSTLEFYRDYQMPRTIDYLTRRDKLLHQFSAMSEENRLASASMIFGVENSLKAYKGRLAGLQDVKQMDVKKKDEEALRQAVLNNPELKSYASAWNELDAVLQSEKNLYAPFIYIEGGRGLAGSTTGYAKSLVRAIAEFAKPNAERLPGYAEARRSAYEASVFSKTPVYKSLDLLLLTDSLSDMVSVLGADNPVVKKILNGQTPEEFAKNAIAKTKLDDPDFRRQLYKGGPEAVAASDDPLVQLFARIDADARQLRKQWEDEVEAPSMISSQKIAKARFAVRGSAMPPDANFTLRLSYGSVTGYVEDGRGHVAPKGSKVPAFTYMGGAYERAAKFGGKGDFELPKSWIEAKTKLNLKTPFDFVSTADIIGGNSGSPTVDRKGEVVGIIFDGNMQSLPGDFYYEPIYNRAVSTDSRAIIEALRKVYRADSLVDEMLSGHVAAVK